MKYCQFYYIYIHYLWLYVHTISNDTTSCIDTLTPCWRSKKLKIHYQIHILRILSTRFTGFFPWFWLANRVHWLPQWRAETQSCKSSEPKVSSFSLSLTALDTLRTLRCQRNFKFESKCSKLSSQLSLKCQSYYLTWIYMNTHVYTVYIYYINLEPIPTIQSHPIRKQQAAQLAQGWPQFSKSIFFTPRNGPWASPCRRSTFINGTLCRSMVQGHQLLLDLVSQTFALASFISFLGDQKHKHSLHLCMIRCRM